MGYLAMTEDFHREVNSVCTICGVDIIVGRNFYECPDTRGRYVHASCLYDKCEARKKKERKAFEKAQQNAIASGLL